jgi:hypothetical protein
MSLIKVRIWLLPLVLGALAMPAQAQDDAAEESTIVVTGRQPVGEDEALDVVRKVARPVDGQLARFQQPVCPRVIGFETRYESIVEARIRQTAAKTGARVGGEGCLHNLFVVIVDDGREFVEELRRREPGAFGGLSRREFARLADGEGAARSWSSTVMTNSVGTVAATPGGGSGGSAVNATAASIGFGGGTNVLRVYESSNIHPSVQQAIGAAWVVIETGATFGKTLDQIADYAAMRGLAMVRPAEFAARADTILALFESGAQDAPDELTAFDLAYLKGLYSVQGQRWARQQVRQLAEAIAREGERANP